MTGWELAVSQWFMSHPLAHSLVLTGIAGVSTKAHSDWQKFQAYKIGDPTAEFKWKVALFQYAQGFIIAEAPVLMAEFYKILGPTGGG